MPRTTGVDILNIKPDPEMGLSQNSNIPVPAVALDQVNKANDDMRVYDHQINLMKYQRKLQNKDRLLEALEKGQVAVGDIEPEDKKYFDEAEKKAREAFLAVKDIEPDENGQNKEYENSKAAQQDLKDVANVLQLRRVELQALRKELAGTVSPSERKAREKHLAEQKAKDPFATVTPYQKSLTVDMEKTFAELQKGALISKGEAINIPSTTTTTKDANGKLTTTTVEKPPAPGKIPTKTSVKSTTIGPDGYLNTEIEIEPEKRWTLDGMKRNANKLYLEPSGEGFAQIQGTFDVFQGNPDDVPKQYLKDANKRLALFHTQNDIGTIKIPGNAGPVNPDDPNDPTGRVNDTGEYPHQINYRVLPDGRIAIQDTAPEFAAKLALANVAGDYVIKAKKGFDEAAFKLNMENAKNKADIMLKGAQAQGHKARAGWYYAKIAGMDDKEQTQVINDGYKYNLTTQQNLAIPEGNGYRLAQIPGNKTTPILTWASGKDGAAAKPVIIKPIGSKPIYGSDPANGATYGKIIGYEGGHYDQQYVFEGKPLTATGLWTMYAKFKKDNPSWAKGFDDYLKMGIATDNLDVKIIGENGSTDRNVHTQALKAISNTNSKKGQEQPFYESFDENNNE